MTDTQMLFESAIQCHYRISRGRYGFTGKEECMINMDYDPCFCMTKDEMVLIWVAISSIEKTISDLDIKSGLIPVVDENSLKEFLIPICDKRKDNIVRINLPPKEVYIKDNGAEKALSTLCAIVLDIYKNSESLFIGASSVNQFKVLLAGILTVNSQFLDLYFMKVRDLLVNTNDRNMQNTIIRELKGLVDLISYWKNKCNDCLNEGCFIEFLEKVRIVSKYRDRVDFAKCMRQRLLLSPLIEDCVKNKREDPCIQFIKYIQKVELDRSMSVYWFLTSIAEIHFKYESYSLRS